MNSYISHNSSSTKALLSLYMDGKNVKAEDMHESLKALSSIEDIDILIDEVYLISIYNYLSPSSAINILEPVALKIGRKIEAQDVTVLDNALLHFKFTLAEVLSNKKISFSKELSSIIKVENLSQLDDMASIALLSFFIGILGKDDSYIRFGSEIAELILAFMNHSGEVEVLFLHEKGSYKKDRCRVSIFILMTLYARLTDSEFIGDYLSKLDPYEGGLFQSVDVEKRLLCRLLEKVNPIASTLPRNSRAEREVNGLIKVDTEGFGYVTTAKKKVGIGSVSYAGRVIIPSFGPHVLPLGKSDLYGLNEPVCDDATIEYGDIRMWSRVKSEDSYGNHHVHSKVLCVEKKLNIESFIWSEKKEEELAMVFFLRGNAVSMNGKSYRSGGLERAFSKTDKIDIDIEGRGLQIQMKEEIEVQLIPLAGQEFFWNSDFILAFPFVPGRVLSLEFVMD